MYTIIYKKPARKTLQRMPRKLAAKFIEAFEKLALDPMQSGLDIKPFSVGETFRLRIGGWRAIYRIEKTRLIIYVVEIGPRGDVYK